MIEVEIAGIQVNLMSQHRIVLLKEIGANRYLTIWVGPFEAEAINVRLQDVEFSRPLSHDLLKNVIETLGAEIEQVVVTDSDTADAIFTGVVQSISEKTISHTGEYTSNERRVELNVDLQLTDKIGEVIWSGKAVSENEAYQVLSEKQSTERNKRVAIEALSKRLAEKIFNRLTADF